MIVRFISFSFPFYVTRLIEDRAFFSSSERCSFLKYLLNSLLYQFFGKLCNKFSEIVFHVNLLLSNWQLSDSLNKIFNWNDARRCRYASLRDLPRKQFCFARAVEKSLNYLKKQDIYAYRWKYFFGSQLSKTRSVLTNSTYVYLQFAQARFLGRRLAIIAVIRTLLWIIINYNRNIKRRY